MHTKSGEEETRDGARTYAAMKGTDEDEMVVDGGSSAETTTIMGGNQDEMALNGGSSLEKAPANGATEDELPLLAVYVGTTDRGLSQ